jgi:hypothetical protein
MKIFRRTDEYALFYYTRNKEILEELQVQPIDERLRTYSHWLRHVTRMNNQKMPEIMLNFVPNGRRRLGRTLKRLSEEAETGLSRPNP